MEENGKLVKVSLEEAAQKVNISKKSLDDYLLQIRFGFRYKFNFNEHKNDKVGILRAFVKRHKPVTESKPRNKKEWYQIILYFYNLLQIFYVALKKQGGL